MVGRGWDKFTGAFNRGFDRLSQGYGNAAGFLIRHTFVMLAVYAVLIGSAGWLIVTTPQGFIPAQDRGYVIVSAQLPGAASLARTTEIVRRDRGDRARYAGHHSRGGFRRVVGRDRTQASNAAALFPVFEQPEIRNQERSDRRIDHRRTPQATVQHRGRLYHRDSAALGARYRNRRRVLPCASRIARAAAPNCWRPRPTNWSVAARKAPGLTQVFSPFSANTPQLFVDIDRVKAQKLGVPSPEHHRHDRTYFGSAYVNDFNILGRTYHVTAQADLPFRKESADLARLRTRNAAGDMVQLGSVVDFSDISGRTGSPRYNLYTSSELKGETTPGTSSSSAIDVMKRLAGETLPSGFSYDGPTCPISRSPAPMRGSMCFRFACCSCFWCWPRNMAAGACRSRSS